MNKLLQNVFEKAQKDTGKSSLRAMSLHVEETLMEEYHRQLSHRTLERYFKGETRPDDEYKDSLAMFLGYESYHDYRAAEEEIENEKKEIFLYKNKFSRLLKIGAVTAGIPLLLGAGYFGFFRNKEECMIWKEDHYEVTKCEGKEGEKTLRPYLLNNFRQVSVSDTTTFFKNGKVKIWYEKKDNKLYYFTALGINPETGNSVKPITTYMIDKYIKK